MGIAYATIDKGYRVLLAFMIDIWCLYMLELCEMALHVHRWGVALIGIILYWAFLTSSWNHISGTRQVLEDDAP